MVFFHFGRKTTVTTGDVQKNTPDQRQLRAEDSEQHTTGLGISLNDFMEQFEADLAPKISEVVTLSGSAMFEFVTLRIVPGRTYAPDDEVEQHLAISADGTIRFRTNTYHHGPGRLGIGRIEQAVIPVSTVQEICRILDTWLYTRGEQTWTPSSENGKWYLRVRFHDGREQVQHGSTGGAYLMEMDLSQFIRERIPLDRLYLFDQEL